MKHLLVLISLSIFTVGPGVSTSQAAARAGTPVAGFGDQGSVLTGFASAPADGSLNEMSARPDGSSIAFGSTSGFRFILASFNPDGSVNTSYGTDGFASSGGIGTDPLPYLASFSTMQSDGKVVVGGSPNFALLQGNLLRFNADGSPDLKFGDDGQVTLPSYVGRMAVDSQDRIVVAMSAGFKTRVSRFTAEGKPDPSFGSGGSATFDFSGTSGYYGISLKHDRITLISPQSVFRLMANGTADTGFGDAGIASGGGRAMAVQGDGKIVTVDGTGGIKRILNDGSLDPDFGDAGNVHVDSGAGNSVTIDPAGRIVVGGITTFFNADSPKDFEAFRLTSDGHLDPTFAGDGIATTDLAPFEGSTFSEDTINSVYALPDGSILAGGTSQYNLGQSAIAFARYTPEGELDPAYGGGDGIVVQRPLLAADDQVFDALNGPESSVLAMGRTAEKTALVKYRSDGSRDPDFGNGGKVSTRIVPGNSNERADSGVRLPDGRQVICSSSGAGSTVSVYDSRGRVDEGFGGTGLVKLPTLRRCYSTLRDSEGRILLGGVDFEDVTTVVRLTEDGELDETYASAGYLSGPRLRPAPLGAPQHNAFDLAPNGDLVMAGDTIGATVARFTPDGQPRESFGEGGSLKLGGFHGSDAHLSTATSVDVTPAGRIVIGGRNQGQIAIAKLTSRGKPVRNFGKDGVVRRTVLEKSRIADLKVQANGMVVGVGDAHTKCSFINKYCDDRLVIVRYLPNGKPDPKFGKKGLVLKRYGLRSKGVSVLLQPRAITIAGYAETDQDHEQFLVARFHR